MTLEILQLISFCIGLVAYTGLTAFLVVTWIKRITGRAVFVASIASLVFLATLFLNGESAAASTAEMAALYCWIILLVRALGLNPANYRERSLRPVTFVVGIASGLLGISVIYAWWLPPIAFVTQNVLITWLFVCELLLCVCGLVVVEQLVRNAREDYRWRVRYLNIGLGTLFAYGIVHNATGLLFNTHIPPLTILQPTIYALAVPFIAIASLRNPRNQLRMNISRRFIFRSGVLIATGSLLLLMGVAGYYVQLFGGDMGTVVVAFVTTLVAVGAFVLMGSSQVRRYLRRLIAQTLYEYRYDYRNEWLRVSEQLTEPSPDFNLAQQLIRALMRTLGSSGGAIWRFTDERTLVPIAQLHAAWDEPLSQPTSTGLKTFFAKRERIIDLKKIPSEALSSVAKSTDLHQMPGLRFLVPLLVEDRLFGVAGLNEPTYESDLAWEDYDVLKLIARQGAGLLALQHADKVLSEAQQLNALNRVSAFIVHDVKTISAQLSLLLENAERHKNNPAFIEDMLATVDNSVSRMNKLLAQLRSDGQEIRRPLNLAEVVSATLVRFELHKPCPRIVGSEEVCVLADEERLADAIGHTIQNAIDATDVSGEVRIRIVRRDQWAELHIEDDGVGMDAEFLDQHLFQPFDSTKGLAGMGIGAYQTREYFRGLGGDVQVTSQPGEGTHFTMRLPLALATPATLDSAHG